MQRNMPSLYAHLKKYNLKIYTSTFNWTKSLTLLFQEHDDGGEEEEELVFRGETHADLLLAGLNQIR